MLGVSGGACSTVSSESASFKLGRLGIEDKDVDTVEGTENIADDEDDTEEDDEIA